MSALPLPSPPQPSYILRGHSSAIHALLFLRHNSWLLSGDAEGFITLWSLATKRPTIVWKAHEASILGADAWNEEKLITQGRDGKVRVWKLPLANEESEGFSKLLPIESTTEPRKQPWMEHSLDIPTVNFCSFAHCTFTRGELSTTDQADQVLLATSGSTDSEIEVYHLPSEKKMAVIPAPHVAKDKAGMVMALRILQSPARDLHVIAGYENGAIYVYKTAPEVGKWQEIYSDQPHKQPVLSLDISPTLEAFFSSAADAIIARHPLPLNGERKTSSKQVATGHSGQQSLQIRSDGKIFATGGWDHRIRVYSAKTLKEVAVLKWHKEGCYAVAFAKVRHTVFTVSDITDEADEPVSGAELASRSASSSLQSVTESRNLKAQNTHWLAAGSKDGKISLWDVF